MLSAMKKLTKIKTMIKFEGVIEFGSVQIKLLIGTEPLLKLCTSTLVGMKPRHKKRHAKL